MMSLVYLAVVLVCGIGWVLSKKAKRAVPTLAWVIVGLALSYGMALAALCVDPYYDDNGLPEFIDWQFRWLWAAEFAGWLSFIVVPLLLAAVSMAKFVRSRRLPPT